MERMILYQRNMLCAVFLQLQLRLVCINKEKEKIPTRR